MLILVAVLIAVLIVAFAFPGSVAELRRRRRWEPSSRRRRDLPSASLRDPSGLLAGWWPDFERQFRAYLREHEREAH
jgi:hypothetical protein